MNISCGLASVDYEIPMLVVILGALLLGALLLAAIAMLFLVVWSIVVVLSPWWWERQFVRSRLRRRLQRERTGEGFDEFMMWFEKHRLPRGAIRETYRELTGGRIGFRGIPIRADDSLVDLFGLYTPHGPDLNLLVTRILRRCGVTLPRKDADFGTPRTVEDLVLLIARLCARYLPVDDKDRLVRPAEAPPESLLRPATVGRAEDSSLLLRPLKGDDHGR